MHSTETELDDYNRQLLTEEVVAVHLFEELFCLVTCLPGPVPLVFGGHVDNQGTVVHLGFGVWYLSGPH